MLRVNPGLPRHAEGLTVHDFIGRELHLALLAECVKRNPKRPFLPRHQIDADFRPSGRLLRFGTGVNSSTSTGQAERFSTSQASTVCPVKSKYPCFGSTAAPMNAFCPCFNSARNASRPASGTVTRASALAQGACGSALWRNRSDAPRTSHGAPGKSLPRTTPMQTAIQTIKNSFIVKILVNSKRSEFPPM